MPRHTVPALGESALTTDIRKDCDLGGPAVLEARSRRVLSGSRPDQRDPISSTGRVPRIERPSDAQKANCEWTSDANGLED